MILDRDQVIGGLRLLKVPFMKDAEIMDIIDSAVFYLKADAPVEPEIVKVRDADTGHLTIVKFCGKCTHKLSDKDFCPHCGKQVKRSTQRWVNKNEHA